MAEEVVPASEGGPAKQKRVHVGAPAKYPARERHMAHHLRGQSVQRRIAAAIRRFDEGGRTQAECARWAGISEFTMSRKLKDRRVASGAAEERVKAGRMARLGVKASEPEPEAAPVEPDSDEGDGGELAPAAEASPVSLGAGPLGLQEQRRVPETIGEFVRTYYGGFKCWNCVDDKGDPVRHEIPEFHDEMMQRMTDPAEKRLLVNCPPEHSKTTNGTVITSIFDIVRDPNIQMAVISAGEDLAKDIVGQIQMFLEDPDIYASSPRNLVDDWGPFKATGRTWTQKQMVVAGRQSAEKDPTLRAFGINSKIYGRRLHRIICDDIADEKNNDTAEKVDKMFKTVTATLDSRVGGNGRLHVVGTRVAPNDVYSRLLELSGYTVMRRSCILDYERQTTLWPDHIGFDEAMKRKGRTTAELFELIYQNSDMMSDEGLFTRQHLDRCHDETRMLGQLPRGVSLDLIVGVDPAGHGKQAGFTAMVLLGIDRTSGQRYLIDLVNVRSMSQPQMQAQIFDWTARYRVRSLRYEAVALQSQIFETMEFRRHLTAHGTRMDRHATNAKSGVSAKWDPVWGVEAMSPTFHNAMVSLPWGDARTIRAVGELEEQLMRFPMDGAPTDLMMAYWIADTGCRLTFERGSTTRFGQRPHAEPVPPSMLKRRRVWSRGQSRPIRSGDFGRGRPMGVPVGLANMDVDDGELEEMFGGR